MPTYIMPAIWSTETFKFLKHGPASVQDGYNLVKMLGGELKAWYALQGGGFTSMWILEAPDAETAFRIAVAASERYAVKIETMRAYDAEEALKILAAKP